MKEDFMDAPSQYLVILQKAYQGDPDSIKDLHYALTKLKERSHNSEYKQKLRQFYNQALNSQVPSKKFAECIKSFIINEIHWLCPSPLINLSSDGLQQGHDVMEEDHFLPSSSTSPITYSYQEEEAMREQQQYLVILQKAYQGNPNSTGVLYDCLVRLKEILPIDYKEKLSWFYAQALNPDVSLEKFARRISKFIEHERRRLREDLSTK